MLRKSSAPKNMAPFRTTMNKGFLSKRSLVISLPSSSMRSVSFLFDKNVSNSLFLIVILINLPPYLG